MAGGVFHIVLWAAVLVGAAQSRDVPKSRVTSTYDTGGAAAPSGGPAVSDRKPIDAKMAPVYNLMQLLLHQALSPTSNAHVVEVQDPMYPGRSRMLGRTLHMFFAGPGAQRVNVEETEQKILDLLFQYPELLDYFRSDLTSINHLMEKYDAERARRLKGDPNLTTLNGCPRGAPSAEPRNHSFVEAPGWVIPTITEEQRRVIQEFNLRLITEGEDNVFAALSPATKDEKWFKEKSDRGYCNPWTYDWRWLYLKATTRVGNTNVGAMQTLATCWEWRSYLRAGNELLSRPYRCDMKAFPAILNPMAGITSECIGKFPREKWHSLLNRGKCKHCPAGTTFFNQNDIMGCIAK